MPLTFLQASNIIEIVSADSQCRWRVNMDYSNKKDFFKYIPDSFGISGSLRNIWMMEQQVDVTDPENAAIVCTGIAEATSKAINEMMSRKLKGIRSADEISRESPASHTATLITTVKGDKYVFDWHSTLNLRNPLITAEKDWVRGFHDGKTFEKLSNLMPAEKASRKWDLVALKYNPYNSDEDYLLLP